MRGLIISNGSGEDRIGLALAQAWRQAVPELELEALALVGSGHIYQSAQIPLRPLHFTPPSQGFAYLHAGLLWQDLRGGLARHIRLVWQDLSQNRQSYDQVIAVGDIVSLLAASRLNARQAFVACALSDHYIAERSPGKSSFDAFQIVWLRHSQTLTFTRDALTAANLQARGVKARFLGNPMLDAFDPESEPIQQALHSSKPILLLLPGSHQDALLNFSLMLAQLQPLQTEAIQIEIVLAPQLSQTAFEAALQTSGLKVSDDLSEGLSFVFTAARGFKLALARAHAVLGLAGTANEQAVAAGVPVVSFHSTGKQYTAAFAEAQQRLLGRGLTYLGPPCPELISWQIRAVLNNPRYRQVAQSVAQERFGLPGASQRIISKIRQSGSAGDLESPSRLARGGNTF